MVLHLTRTYYPDGTNGILECDELTICQSIELPWKGNKRMVSCIPEGKYWLEKRFSKKFQWHVLLLGVPNRSLILVHPANNAAQELNGCIAPVSKIAGAGLGLMSRKAFVKLKAMIYGELDKGHKVLIIIKS